MARPFKSGIDYFPLNVSLCDKFELIEAVHGVAGFGIVIKLYQKVYSEGFYLNVTEETLLVFSKRVNVDINQVNAVINDAVKWGIFNRELYEKYSVLTSKGIQERYFEIVRRRKRVSIDERFLLIDPKLEEQTELIVNADINEINDDNNSENVNGGTQSKVKKSKEKNFPENSNEFRLAVFLLNHIRKHKPDFKKPNLQGWARVADFILRIDHRDVERVKAVIAWSRTDGFWSTTILSMTSLRKHFDILEMKMSNGNGTKSEPKPDRMNRQEFKDFLLKAIGETANQDELLEYVKPKDKHLWLCIYQGAPFLHERGEPNFHTVWDRYTEE